LPVAELDLSDDLALIREAAAQAGRIAMRFFRRDPEVWFKAGASPVSEADMAVDAFLKRVLIGERPDYGWISEETADERAAMARSRSFIVDPIDGTRAFIEGSSVWCVSIGVVENGRPVAGVLDSPARGEAISAVLGSGARQNGEPIAVRTPVLPFDIAGPKTFINRLPQALGSEVRSHPYVPSLAYRLAMVARGEIDGTFVKPNSHDWDLAAADVILSEAGGGLVRADGSPIRYATGNPRQGALAAASGRLLAAMRAVIAAES